MPAAPPGVRSWLLVHAGTFTVLAFALLAVGCTSRHPDGDLERLRREVNAENDRRLAARPSGDAGDETWTLTVEGQTTHGRSRLSMPELVALATAHVLAPWDHDRPGVDVDYRVVPAATLLDRVGVADGVSEITFVASDGHRSTVLLTDAQSYPLGLAVEGDGKRLTRETGGPLFLVFPSKVYPELTTYGGTKWAFYVTHLIIGTEPARLHVAGVDLDAAAIDRLPQRTISVTTRSGVSWPTEAVSLRGASLTDILAAARASLASDEEVVVDARPLVWKESEHQLHFTTEDLRACAPLLATRWGKDAAPIPARMGGPLILAFATDCPQHHDDHQWPTFVERLAVRKRAR